MAATLGRVPDLAGVVRSVPGLRAAWIRHGRLKASLLVSFVVAFVAVVFQQCFSDNFPFDFAYFHAAGRTWRAGMDPYGPEFASFAFPYIPERSALWAYPPQWWGITVALAALNMTPAVIVWKTASLTALMAGCALLYDVFARSARRATIATGLIFTIALTTSDAAWISLRIGQTSLFMLFGFALLLHGLRNGGEGRTILGLLILLLKPQFGLFFALILLTLREGRRPVLIATSLSLLACLPLLLSFGIDGTIESAHRFLSSLASYDDQPWNRPGSLSGISFVAAVIGLPPPPALVTVLLAWTVAVWLRQRAARHHGPISSVHYCLYGLSALYALAPLHGYDLILLPVFLLILPELKSWAGWFIALGIFGIWRLGSFAYSNFGEQISSWKPGVFVSALIQAGVGTMAVTLALVALAFGWRPSKQAECVETSRQA